MRSALMDGARALGGFVTDLGFVGFVLAIFGLFGLVLCLMFLNYVVQVLENFSRWWRRLPLWLRWTVAIPLGFWLAPMFWGVIPWRDAFLALVAGALVAFSVGGFVYGQRYDIHDSPWAAWSYHARVTVSRKREGKAVDSGTGKKGARVLSKKLGPDHDESLVMPGDGLSAAQLADEINAGTLQSSYARQLGLQNVKNMAATVNADSTVLVRVDHEVPTEDPFFSTIQDWPGVENG